MVGSVGIYEGRVDGMKGDGGVVKMSEEDLVDGIEKEGKDGGDLMSIEWGVSMDVMNGMKGEGGYMEVVSGGG